MRTFFEMSRLVETSTQEFLSALVGAGEDELPWLVFADWLDETGKSELAQAIRLAMNRAATDPGQLRAAQEEVRRLLSGEKERLGGLGYEFSFHQAPGGHGYYITRVTPPGKEPGFKLDLGSLEFHADGLYSFKNGTYRKLALSVISRPETVEALAVAYLSGRMRDFQAMLDHDRARRMAQMSHTTRNAANPGSAIKALAREVYEEENRLASGQKTVSSAFPFEQMLLVLNRLNRTAEGQGLRRRIMDLMGQLPLYRAADLLTYATRDDQNGWLEFVANSLDNLGHREASRMMRHSAEGDPVFSLSVVQDVGEEEIWLMTEEPHTFVDLIHALRGFDDASNTDTQGEPEDFPADTTYFRSEDETEQTAMVHQSDSVTAWLIYRTWDDLR